MAEAVPAADVASGGDSDSGRPQREKKAPQKFEPSTGEGAKKPRKRKAPVEKASKKEKKGTGAKKGRKGKKKSTGPKRAKSPFIYFTNEKRPDVKRTNPEMTFGEVAKTLGKLWGELGAGQKKKYEDMAAKDKKRYEKEKAAMGGGDAGGDAGDEDPQEDMEAPADEAMGEGEDMAGY